MVLRDASMWHWHYLAAKPYHMGVNGDELSCPCTVLSPIEFPSWPTYCDCQAGAQSPWTGTTMSNHLTWGSAGFTSFLPEGERPLGRDALLQWRRFESSGVEPVRKWGMPLSEGTFLLPG
jgi:hypothetical protein